MAEPGKKILISGGGRCNFTHLAADPSHFLSANPHFARSALARFTPRDFLAKVERHGIPWREKAPGQLFCDGPARRILDMLLAECRDAGVRVVTGCRVGAASRDTTFAVATSRGVFRCGSLVVATGGLSIPSLGATDLGYRLARQFGLAVEPTRPALVPFLLEGRDRSAAAELAGVAFEGEVSCGAGRFRDKVLFTHRGLSGPAILQASSYWAPGGPVTVDMAPGLDVTDLLQKERRRGSRAEVRTLLAERLPRRIAEWRSHHDGPRKVVSQLSDREICGIGESLHSWTFVPAGTEGYAKAEVTAGGVSTHELSSRTLQCHKVPGLHFIGEVVDVTGFLGGFNFQWAWASAHAAGEAV